MKKILLSLLSFTISLITIHAQYTYDWSAQFGGSNTDYAYGIAVDNDGNVISGGEFRETVDFDPSEDGEALITASFLNNAYISKLNANGEYVWAHAIEGESRVLDVHTDNAGNVYACGWFHTTVDFLAGDEEILLTPIGQYDAFLVKYTASGDFVWAFAVGGLYHDYFMGMDVDSDGNLIVCGKFTDVVDFDPSSGVAELTEAFGFYTDAFVAKYDSDGNYAWARQFAGENLQEATGVSLTSTGDIVVAGMFSGPTDFEPGAGELIFDNGSELDWQGFVVKLNNDGELIWAKSFGGADQDWLYDLAVDEQGNAYVVGGFKSTADFDPGAGVFEMTTEGFMNDPYILKLDANGDFVWAGQFAGASDGGAYAIDVVQGAIYTVGYAQGTCDFDPGVGVNTENSGAANYYGFIAVLDTQGQYLWSDRIGNGGGDFCNAVVADEEHVYAAGYFRGNSIWFGNNSFNAVGLDDAYVTKIQHPVIDNVVKNEKFSITVYPNPANDFITLSGLSGYTDIVFSDATGKAVMIEKATSNATLTVSHLMAGIYTLTIMSGNDIVHGRIVLSR